MADEDRPVEVTGDVPVEDLIPCSGCCCYIHGCYTVFPDCLGCSGKCSCICCKSAFSNCKVAKEDDDWCVVGQMRTVCGNPDVCCMNRGQFFCNDVRCSIPPSDDIPCMCGYCFLTICYKSEFVCTCCTSVRDLEVRVANK